jgi:hypothetical protein
MQVKKKDLQKDKTTIGYDEQYLKKLRDKAKKSWLGNINADEWLKEIRGYD